MAGAEPLPLLRIMLLLLSTAAVSSAASLSTSVTALTNAPALGAAALWVSASHGSDSNAGTFEAPLSSLQAAADAIAAAFGGGAPVPMVGCLGGQQHDVTLGNLFAVRR